MKLLTQKIKEWKEFQASPMNRSLCFSTKDYGDALQALEDALAIILFDAKILGYPAARQWIDKWEGKND